MLRALKWFGWAALPVVVFGGAWAFGWSHYLAEGEPLEPGPFYEINPDIVTGVLLSATDYKLYAYRWSGEENFRIVVLWSEREGIEECDAGGAFVRWFEMTTEMPIGRKLDRAVDPRVGEWVMLELIDATVLEGVESRLRLPATPDEPIIWQFGQDQYPVKWDPEAFGIVKSGCMGLGTRG